MHQNVHRPAIGDDVMQAKAQQEVLRTDPREPDAEQRFRARLERLHQQRLKPLLRSGFGIVRLAQIVAGKRRTGRHDLLARHALRVVNDHRAQGVVTRAERRNSLGERRLVHGTVEFDHARQQAISLLSLKLLKNPEPSLRRRQRIVGSLRQALDTVNVSRRQIAQMRGKPSRRGVVHDIAEPEFHAKDGVDPLNQPRRGQAVSARREEVIASAEFGLIENVPP